jgi:tRNA pseudouridine55 synthase
VKSRSVGHTGTLDPFATGLLILLTGRATRLARFVEQQHKTYLATARLGQRTTTDDGTGEPTGGAVSVSAVSGEAVRAALALMTGIQLQIPPAYSAKKVGGERSYRLARRGQEVFLAPVEVEIERLDLLRFEPPLVSFRATVSAGTYVRALARDLGDKLGVGAYLEALRRESIGSIRVEDAIPLAELGTAPRLVPLAEILVHLDEVELSEEEMIDVSHGRPVRRDAPISGPEFVRLMGAGEVLGVARRDGEWLRPVVVLVGK